MFVGDLGRVTEHACIFGICGGQASLDVLEDPVFFLVSCEGEIVHLRFEFPEVVSEFVEEAYPFTHIAESLSDDGGAHIEGLQPVSL
jgi:hypothetical protein